MNTSTNTLLEQGIQEVTRLAGRITALSEQEAAFKGVAGSLKALQQKLAEVNAELDRLNVRRETMKWRIVWCCLGSFAILQMITIVIIIFKS